MLYCPDPGGLDLTISCANHAADSDTFTLSYTPLVRVVQALMGAGPYLAARVRFTRLAVRDEARLYDGIGLCGRELCCATFRTRFEPGRCAGVKHKTCLLIPCGSRVYAAS